MPEFDPTGFIQWARTVPNNAALGVWPVTGFVPIQQGLDLGNTQLSGADPMPPEDLGTGRAFERQPFLLPGPYGPNEAVHDWPPSQPGADGGQPRAASSAPPPPTPGLDDSDAQFYYFKSDPTMPETGAPRGSNPGNQDGPYPYPPEEQSGFLPWQPHTPKPPGLDAYRPRNTETEGNEGMGSAGGLGSGTPANPDQPNAPDLFGNPRGFAPLPLPDGFDPKPPDHGVGKPPPAGADHSSSAGSAAGQKQTSEPPGSTSGRSAPPPSAPKAKPDSPTPSAPAASAPSTPEPNPQSDQPPVQPDEPAGFAPWQPYRIPPSSLNGYGPGGGASKGSASGTGREEPNSPTLPYGPNRSGPPASEGPPLQLGPPGFAPLPGQNSDPTPSGTGAPGFGNLHKAEADEAAAGGAHGIGPQRGAKQQQKKPGFLDRLRKGFHRLDDLGHQGATQYGKMQSGMDKQFEGTPGQYVSQALNSAADTFNLPGMLSNDPFADDRPLWKRIQDGEYSSYQVDPIRNPNVGGSLLGMAALGALGERPVELKEYGGSGGGHHLPAKSAFEGDLAYHRNRAFAIPNPELKRLGLEHPEITTAQMAGYRAFAKTGAPITWAVTEKIETKALEDAGLQHDLARQTVRRAIRELKKSGVTGPTRIPWNTK